MGWDSVSLVYCVDVGISGDWILEPQHAGHAAGLVVELPGQAARMFAPAYQARVDAKRPCGVPQ